MKWIVCCISLVAFAYAPFVHAQDAATEERLNKLGGQIEDLIVAQKAQQRQISELIREMQELREQSTRPNQNYSTHDDLRRIADSIKEVDRKRIDDAKNVQEELLRIRKLLTAPPPAPPSSTKKARETAEADMPPLPDKYFEHTVGRGDTLSTIVEAYRAQNIKVTIEGIKKANPGLKPERLQIGQKIVIPAP